MLAAIHICRSRLPAWVAVGAFFLTSSTPSPAQSPDEHAAHHPVQPAAAAPGGTPAAGAALPGTAGAPGMAGMGAPAAAGAPAGAGGMMEQMGEMMKSMGKPPPKEIYPTLMSLPDLSPEQRVNVERQADERTQDGSTLMAQALDTLTTAAPSNDYGAMHEAITRLREGIAQLESGVAARRALAEGRPPRDVSMTWFKQEMSLPLAAAPVEHGPLGASPFHLFTMVLLVAFALAMLLLYFFKMRRAAALFGRIDPDKESPPPGSVPPLDGGSGPSGGKPPTAGTPGAVPPPDDKAQTPAPGEKSPTPPSPEKSSNPEEPLSAPLQPPGMSSNSKASQTAPLTAKWSGRLRADTIVSETPAVQTFRLSSIEGGPLPFIYTPGQFLNVAFGIGGARMNRSYSISSSPHERGYVELTIKREPRGAVSRHLNDLIKVGDEIEAGGPVGKFTFTGTEADSIVLVSAGVGITPMMSISRYLTEQSWPGDIFFIYACRTEADFIFKDALAALKQRNPKLHLVITLSKPGPEWKGPRGRITKELLAQAVPDLASRRVHVCGPPTMMDATKAMLTELGVSADNLKSEQFGAVKPAPAAPGTSVKLTAAAAGPLVTFSKNNKSAKIRLDLQTGDSPPKQSILELSEELGIGIEFSCRVGTCGVCKVKMTSGEVDMEVQDALDEDDKKNGIILACQAKPKGEVTVEA